MITVDERQRLPLRPLICYSVGNVALTAMYGFLGTFLLKYYTDDVKLDPAWVGWALFVRALVDVAIDPAIGYWSDRTPVSIGRRRPYFLLGTIPAALFFYLTMIPPSGSEWVVFLYLTVMSSLMVCFLSLMGITHLAMGFEMTADYDERTRIFGYKNLVENLTILVATFSVPLTLQLAETTWFGHTFTRRECYQVAAAVLGLISVISAIVAYMGTTEQGLVPEECHYGFVEGVIGVFRNQAFLVLSVVFVLITIADRVITAELFIVIEHFHGMKEEDSTPLLAGFFLGGLISVWPWVWLAQRFGKDVMLRVAIAVWPLMCIAFVLQPWSLWPLCIVALGIGISGTGMLTILGAIVPDVLDYGSPGVPQRREGLYVSIGNLIYQMAMGIGFLIAGLTLHGIGYQGESRPDSNLILSLRWTFAVIPTLLALGAILAMQRFPITKRSYRKRVFAEDQSAVIDRFPGDP